jgi:hypothetical protein
MHWTLKWQLWSTPLRHATNTWDTQAGKCLGPFWVLTLSTVNVFSKKQGKLTIPLLIFLHGGTKEQRKPVAQPFRQTQWTHRPIRLHLPTPTTRASMSTRTTPLLLSLFLFSFLFFFLSLMDYSILTSKFRLN